jgi:hypothetical protein
MSIALPLARALGALCVLLCAAAAARADAEPEPRLSLAVLDQRPSARIAPRELADSLAGALGASVDVLDDSSGEADFGLLSVLVVGQRATLVWTLPDGRTSSSHVALAPKAPATIARLTSEFMWMVTTFASSYARHYGELLDPYCLHARHGVSPAMRTRQAAARPSDLLDPYEQGAAHRSVLRMPDPWR